MTAVEVSAEATYAADVALLEAKASGKSLSDEAVRAAAPFIARAVRIDELRTMADQLKLEAARDHKFEKGREASGLSLAATMMLMKALRLERGEDS